MVNVIVYKGCVIDVVKGNIRVMRNGNIIHEVSSVAKTTLSKIITMIDEGEI